MSGENTANGMRLWESCSLFDSLPFLLGRCSVWCYSFWLFQHLLHFFWRKREEGSRAELGWAMWSTCNLIPLWYLHSIFYLKKLILVFYLCNSIVSMYGKLKVIGLNIWGQWWCVPFTYLSKLLQKYIKLGKHWSMPILFFYGRDQNISEKSLICLQMSLFRFTLEQDLHGTLGLEQ